MTPQLYILVIYIIVMLMGRFISQGQRKARQSLLSQSQAITKEWTALLTAFSAAIAIALPVLEYTLKETLEGHMYLRLIGLAVVVAGYWVAYAANHTISKNWSPTVDKTQKQNLVTSGVYSTIRHPLYLSGLLILVGTNTYFGSSWAWAGVLLTLIVILIRLPIEERYLVVRFGEEYIAYQKRTKAILPWIV